MPHIGCGADVLRERRKRQEELKKLEELGLAPKCSRVFAPAKNAQYPHFTAARDPQVFNDRRCSWIKLASQPKTRSFSTPATIIGRQTSTASGLTAIKRWLSLDGIVDNDTLQGELVKIMSLKNVSVAASNSLGSGNLTSSSSSCDSNTNPRFNTRAKPNLDKQDEHSHKKEVKGKSQFETKAKNTNQNRHKNNNISKNKMYLDQQTINDEPMYPRERKRATFRTSKSKSLDMPDRFAVLIEQQKREIERGDATELEENINTDSSAFLLDEYEEEDKENIVKKWRVRADIHIHPNISKSESDLSQFDSSSKFEKKLVKLASIDELLEYEREEPRNKM